MKSSDKQAVETTSSPVAGIRCLWQLPFPAQTGEFCAISGDLRAASAAETSLKLWLVDAKRATATWVYHYFKF